MADNYRVQDGCWNCVHLHVCASWQRYGSAWYCKVRPNPSGLYQGQRVGYHGICDRYEKEQDDGKAT